MILQHFVDSCDRLRLISADFERRNIGHVREPQNPLIELDILVIILRSKYGLVHLGKRGRCL